MATKIKLMRMGKMRAPYYRVVVADARTKRDGRAIETIGKYHPKEDPSFIEIDADRAAYWLGVGAQPTEAVTAILKVTGDWQIFKGEPAPPPMLVAAPKRDKKAAFEAAALAGDGAGDAGRGGATTPKAKKAAGEKAGEKAVDKAADTATTAEPTADQAAATAADQGETLVEARAEAGDTAGVESAPEAPAAGTAAETPAEAPAADKAPES